MKYEVRDYLRIDYEMIDKWCDSWGVKNIPMEYLPQVGLVAFNSITMKDVCAGFVYKTDSPIVIFDGIVSNPDCTTLERGKAIQRLVMEMFDRSRLSGAKAMISYSDVPAVLKCAEKFKCHIMDKEKKMIARGI